MPAAAPYQKQPGSLPGDALDQHAGLAQRASGLPNAVRRGADMAAVQQAVVPTGFAALDAQLPDGGWPCQCLTELRQPQPSLCKWHPLAPTGAQPQALGQQKEHILMCGPAQATACVWACSARSA